MSCSVHIDWMNTKLEKDITEIQIHNLLREALISKYFSILATTILKPIYKL